VCLSVITICDFSLLGFWFGDGWFFLSLSPGVIDHVVGILFPVGIYFLLVFGGFCFRFGLALSCTVGSRSIEICGWCFLRSRKMAGVEDSNCRLQIHTYILT